MANVLRSGEALGLHRSMAIADTNGGTVAEVSFKDALPLE
jgi:hypothetical protein